MNTRKTRSKVSRYQELRAAPMKSVELEEGNNYVEINMVSAMCDNKSKIIIQKKPGSIAKVTYKNGSCLLSFPNLNCGYDADDIAWEFEDGKLSTILKMLNEGTSAVESVRQRKIS